MKGGQDLEPFLKLLKRKVPKLEAIAMDMGRGFISAARPMDFETWCISD